MLADDHLVLHIYPPSSGDDSTNHPYLAGRVYSDAGDGYGPSRLDCFTLCAGANGLVMDWESQGDYPFPYAGVDLRLHGPLLLHCWIDGIETRFAGNSLESGVFKEARFEL